MKIVWEKLNGYDFSANHSLEELGFTEKQANIYSATPDYDLKQTLKQIDIKASDTILDFGAGKGAAMLCMSKFNFAKVDGVELSVSMHKIGQQNLLKCGLKNSKIFLSNAIDFKELDDYNFFYFFNPFPAEVLAEVIENIKQSHQNHRREITLLYYLPAFRQVIDNSPLFQLSKRYRGRYFEMLVYKTCQKA